MIEWSIAEHGDQLEHQAWESFLAEQFPAYEDFWRVFIVPLTARPDDIRFRTDQELEEMRRSPADVAIAQLHYTVLVHLHRGDELRCRDQLDGDGFMEAVVRLSAALDVADELLERHRTPGNYGPWSEDDGRKARFEWRKRYPDRGATAVREYRNRLVHGRVPPGLIVDQGWRLLYPDVEHMDRHLDWRLAFAAVDITALIEEEFGTTNEIVDECWSRVTGYLERQWRTHLIA